MKVHELNLTGAKNRKRVGRGISAGQGKTAGRGTKGQNSRSGGGVRPGFEGGQNPLAKRLPKKRGFAALSRITYQIVNLSDLAKFKTGDKVNANTLVGAGIIKKADLPIKLLGDGKLELKLVVTVHGASKTAKAAIEKAGGKLEIVDLKPTPKARTKPASSDKPAKEQASA